MSTGEASPPDQGQSEPLTSVGSATSPSLQTVARTSASWNCVCAHTCNSEQAANCLYQHALDVLSDTQNSTGIDAIQRLIGPLITLVGCQKTRYGQAECRKFVRTLLNEDEGSAILACRNLAALADTQAMESQKIPD